MVRASNVFRQPPTTTTTTTVTTTTTATTTATATATTTTTTMTTTTTTATAMTTTKTKTTKTTKTKTKTGAAAELDLHNFTRGNLFLCCCYSDVGGAQFGSLLAYYVRSKAEATNANTLCQVEWMEKNPPKSRGKMRDSLRRQGQEHHP